MFASNDEALDHLREAADVLLVSYANTSETMPWIKTSFPSKLIEYSHLGLPIVVVAPSDSAVARWCRDQGLCGVFQPNESHEIRAFVKEIMTEHVWASAANQWSDLARTQWSPEQIQTQFENLLFPQPSTKHDRAAV